MSETETKTETEELDSILNFYLDTLKNIQYTPLIYKLSSLEPKDLYDLFFSYDKNYNLSNLNSYQSFVLLFNLLFIDINILYTFIYINNDQKRDTGTEKEILNNGGIDYEKIIKDDTEKVYSENKGIINIINNNNNNNNTNVASLFNEHYYFDINKNNYFTDTKFLSLKNFIKIIYLLSNEDYTNRDKIVKILLYIVSKYDESIVKYILQYRVFKIGTNTEYKYLINKIDEILYSYSTENVLTFLKIRSDNGDNYNKRFNYKLYPTNNDDPKIMNLLYNDDDISYYNYGDGINEDGSININNLNYLEKNYEAKKLQKEHINIRDKNYKYSYVFGPLTKIYNHNINNKDISEKMDIVVRLLLDQKPVFILGYGASGSGKTSTLIYFNKGRTDEEKNGILIHLCNLMGNKGFTKIKLKCREVFLNKDKTPDKPDIRYFPGDSNSKNESLEFTFEKNEFLLNTFTDSDKKKYKYKNVYEDKSYPDTEIIFNNETKLGEIIVHLIDKDRFVAATTNNPNSSRSHSLIFVTLIKENKDSGTETESKIIIGDFAGVENLFECGSEDFKNKFNDVKRDINLKEDEEKKVKIQNLINNLENKIKKDTKIQDELNVLKNKLKSIDEERYYYRYPEEEAYKKTQKPLENYIIELKDIYISTKKGKVENDNLTPIMNYLEKKKYTYTFNYDNNSNLLVKTKEEYNVNTDNCISILLTKEKREIVTSYINLLNKLKVLSTEKKLPNVQDIELLLLKAIIGIKCKENYTADDIQNISDIKSTDNSKKKLLDYIIENFKEENNQYNHAKYTKYFLEKFNTARKQYETAQKGDIEKNNKLNYGKEICNIRRNEGVFINNSLNNVRDIINYIIYKKNENKLTISPPFIDKCLNFYCEQDICFNTKKYEIYNTYDERIKKFKFNIEEQNPFSSIIFNVIADELKTDIFKIIISVFCVFNISKKANNPPPVPYISINKLKYFYYNKNYEKVKEELEKIICEYKNKNPAKYDETCKLNNYDEKKINNILDNETFKNLLETRDNIIEEIDNKTDNEKDLYNNQLKSLFDLFNNFNSASAIGTLEFVDSLAKYNTINSICEIREYKHL